MKGENVMKRKVFLVLLCLITALALVGCGTPVDELASARETATTEVSAFAEKAEYADLETEDVAQVIADAVEAIKVAKTQDDIDTAVSTAKTTLDDMVLAKQKETAKASLDTYVDLSLYSEGNKSAIETIIADAKTAIDGCTTVAEIILKVNEAKTAIGEVKTILQTAKETAKAEIESYIQDESIYSANGLATINQIIADAKTNIDNATDQETIDAIVVDAKADLDEVPTLAQEQEAAANAFKNSLTTDIGNVVEELIRVSGGDVIIDAKDANGTMFHFGNQDGNNAVYFDTYITVDYRNTVWSGITIYFRAWDTNSNYKINVKDGKIDLYKTQWIGGKVETLLMKNATGIKNNTKMHLQIVCCGWTKKVLLDGVCIFEIIEDGCSGRMYIETWQSGITLGTPQYIEYENEAALKAEHQALLDAQCVNKSEAQILSEAKDAAKTTVSGYLQDVETSYSETNQAVIAGIISQAETAIDGCKSVEEVDAAVVAIKAQLDAVLTLEQETALSDAKTAAKATIAGYLEDVESNYSEANQAVIAEIISQGNTAIDACATIDEVNAAVAEIKSKLDAVYTIEDEQNTELIAKKTAAKEEIENYLENVETNYSEENQAVIASIIEKGKTDIDACADENAIASVVADVKEQLSSVLTINQEGPGKLAEDFKAICSNVYKTPVDSMEVKDGKLISDTKEKGVSTNFKFGKQTGNINRVFDAYMTIDYLSASSSVTIRFGAWDTNSCLKMVINQSSIKIYFRKWDSDQGKAVDTLLVNHEGGIANGQEFHLQILSKGWTKMVLIDDECILNTWPNKCNEGHTMIETWEAGIILREPKYKEYDSEAALAEEYGEVMQNREETTLENEIPA